MTDPIFFDTETCGLHGPIVLIQYAQGDEDPILHSVWKEPIEDTLALIERLCTNPGGVIGFNLTFDWFHICQLYTCLVRLNDHSLTPEECIDEYIDGEPKARDGDCLKPVKACDTMLVARRGPYQAMMARKPIKIRRVPTVLAHQLAAELQQRVKLSDIYFSKRKDSTLPQWQVMDINDKDAINIDPNFKNVVLNFRASTALKVIATDMLGSDRYGRHRNSYDDISLDRKLYPGEVGFAPFALALSDQHNHWKISKKFPIKKVRNKYAWPAVIAEHIFHWHYREEARSYAYDDVLDTRNVWKGLGSPEPGDVDSELACMVGACRWRGFSIDVAKVKQLRTEKVKEAKLAPRSPREVREYITSVMAPMERLGAIKDSTSKMILESIGGNAKEGKLPMMTDCPGCNGEGDCSKCDGTGEVEHPAAQRARNVLSARKAKKDVEMYDKLIIAGRFHASFVVIGTLSSRMAGTDDFNPQAIRNDKKVRSAFTLKHPGTVLGGGDFEAFEVSLAEANYNDAKLREQLLSTTDCYSIWSAKENGDNQPCLGRNKNCGDCHGSNRARTKIHALFGTICYPKMSYADIVADKVTYTKSKSGFFAKIYGGTEHTLMTRLGVEEEVARQIDARFGKEYPGVAAADKRIFDRFCSMRQPVAYGKVEWHEPADFVENMLTPPFRRYFILENQICKALYELANNPPKVWRELKNVKVQRDVRNPERQQTAAGAVQSALFGAAFQIQAANVRAAKNHEIQSTGAEITKATQVDIWKLQPSGINKWLVQPMNIHDEIECVVKDDPALIEQVKQVVLAKVESYRPLVPLIGMEWKTNMESWGEK
jgi:hypothetical protein